jgi:hypothetical protein
MDEEIVALDVNATWELVALPEDKKAIGCKWVYKVKHNANGSMSRYKARLVAKGYAQTYGIDYEETYSPIAKMTIIKAIIAMATTKRWSLHQMDVENVFLHGDLHEEVYMEQPPSYVDQTHPNLAPIWPDMLGDTQLINYLRGHIIVFNGVTCLVLYGIDNALLAFAIVMPSLHNIATSLCCSVDRFILVVVILRYDCKPILNIIIKKLSMVGICKP